MLENLKNYTEDLEKCEDEFNSILTKTEILLDDILRDFFQMGLDKNYKNNSWKKILEREIEKGYQDRNSKGSFENAWKAITNFGIEKYGVKDMDTSLIVALIRRRNSPFACCSCSEQIRSLLMGHLREDRNIFAHKNERISYELEVRHRIVANTIEHCREFTFAVRDAQNGETIPLEDVRVVYQEKYRDKLNALESRNKKAFKEYNLVIAKSELEKNSEDTQAVDKSNIIPLGINKPNKDKFLDGSAKIEKTKFHGKPALLISRRDGKIKIDKELYFWCVVDKEMPLEKKYDKGGAYYQLTKECIGKYIYGCISAKGYKGRLEIKYGPVSEKDFLQDMDSTSVVEDNGEGVEQSYDKDISWLNKALEHEKSKEKMHLKISIERDIVEDEEILLQRERNLKKRDEEQLTQFEIEYQKIKDRYWRTDEYIIRIQSVLRNINIDKAKLKKFYDEANSYLLGDCKTAEDQLKILAERTLMRLIFEDLSEKVIRDKIRKFEEGRKKMQYFLKCLRDRLDYEMEENK